MLKDGTNNGMKVFCHFFNRSITSSANLRVFLFSNRNKGNECNGILNSESLQKQARRPISQLAKGYGNGSGGDGDYTKGIVALFLPSSLQSHFSLLLNLQTARLLDARESISPYPVSYAAPSIHYPQGCANPSMRGCLR